MAVENFSNVGSTTVVSGGTDAPSAGTSQSWTVASSSSFPTANNAATPPTQFHIVDPDASSEIMLVTNVSGTTWTVTRGVEGTTPVAHLASFFVTNVVTAEWLTRAQTSLGFAANVGNGSSTSLVVTHNLGTRDVLVQVYRVASPFDSVVVDVERTSTNSVTVAFASAPATNEFRVLVSPIA